MHASRWDGCEDYFEVPKGTKVKEISDLLESDYLDKYDWLDGRGARMNPEDEIQSGQYCIDHSKRVNFGKLHEHYRGNENG